MSGDVLGRVETPKKTTVILLELHSYHIFENFAGDFGRKRRLDSRKKKNYKYLRVLTD